MRKHFVKHDNLRRYLGEFEENQEDVSDETLNKLLNELKHSNLIIAADLNGPSNRMAFVEIKDRRYGFLFTDMDEYRKFIKGPECGCQSCDFEMYKRIVDDGLADGFVLNPESEGFVIIREIFDAINYLPQHDYEPVDAYTSEELKSLKESIDNPELEDFLKDPSNIGRYEELFEEISNSTLLTLMVSREDLTGYVEDGVISMVDNPMGFLYLDKLGGKYATVYTSEAKIGNVPTQLNKYSQIVNFSQLTNYILNDDLDGIIINPNSENVLLTRDVLLDYWFILEGTCNDERLYSAIMHMFPIEEGA